MAGKRSDYSESSGVEIPNYNYLNELEDYSLKESMLQILQLEFQQFCKTWNNVQAIDDPSLLFLDVHKLSSKFSILGMNQAYLLSKKIEDDLKNQFINQIEIQQLLATSQRVVHHLQNDCFD